MEKQQMELDFKAAANLRDSGIKRAVDHANREEPVWSEKAFNFLREYIRSNREFMVEQLRSASTGKVPEPPTTRAWGGIVVRAKKMGLIKRKGYRKTSNKKAHCTPATLWESVC